MEFVYKEDEEKNIPKAVAMIDQYGNLCFRPQKYESFTQLYLGPNGRAQITADTTFDNDARTAEKLFFPGDEITIKF